MNRSGHVLKSRVARVLPAVPVPSTNRRHLALLGQSERQTLAVKIHKAEEPFPQAASLPP